MRTHGTIAKWNDDRGFGFVIPAQGTDEVFIHISAFSRGSTRPQLHDLISFEIETDEQGRKRALRANRPGEQAIRRRPQRSGRGHFFALSAILIVMIALASFDLTERWRSFSPPAESNRESTPARGVLQNSGFQCDGRIYCSQMSSCAEARFFIANCPNTKMDGDGDGEPCESQRCG